MKRILCFLFVALLFVGCTKEEYGSISGVIYDSETIAPQVGVTVELFYDLSYCSFPDKCTHTETVLSDYRGGFSFTDLEAGTYTLRIVIGKSQKQEGYDWVWVNDYLEKEVELSAGAHMEVDIPYTKNKN